ncbi:MAG: polysaccharide biosynthesis/export family protein [Pseudomonadota bacterium]
MYIIRLTLVFALGLYASCGLTAEVTEPAQYKINSGDVLSVHVWNEDNVSQKEILVRPDGRISIPIVGEVVVAGKSIATVKDELSTRLSSILIDKPVVTVSIIQLSGNTVFVLGKVARPGQYIILGQLDVTQALALAGGTTTFAQESDIKVLRRNHEGKQKSINFNYAKIVSGKNLEDNILIQSGDVVIVP